MVSRMFNGFTTETSEFLWELRFNNERPWFLAHKEQFERCLNEPFKTLAAETQAQMQARFPHITWRSHCSRIYRDARRLFGRGPYKDHLWFVLAADDGSFKDGPAFWFEIGPAGFEYGVGFFAAPPATMELFRKMVDANPARFERLFGELEHMRGLRIAGEEYKRRKGAYDKPVADWYSRRWLGAEWVKDFGGELLEPDLPEFLAKAYTRLMPLYDFLRELYVAAAEKAVEEAR